MRPAEVRHSALPDTRNARRGFQLPARTGTVTISLPDRRQLLAEVRARLAAGQGFALATVNLDHLVKLERDDLFARAYARHDMVVADGRPVVWLSRLARRPVELVPGSDMVVPLARLAAETGASVALVGATENTLACAAARLEAEAPGLRIAARIAPAMGFAPDGAEADAVLAALEGSGASLTFLALGAPRQERFAARGRDSLPEMGFASIGAGLDFLAGTQVRAPRWMRRIALEWAWRLGSDPRRLARRYADCASLLPTLALRVWRDRPSSGA